MHRILVLLTLLCVFAGAQAKSLSWREVAVEARLDANGLLHVVETQTFLFDGDWNGGERRFHVRAGQTLSVEGIDRVDGDRRIPLARGNLDTVDHFDMVDESTLRWRSRRPDDPEFEAAELTYRIRYTLGGILRGIDNRYQLAHDFAFPDRPGDIARFVLDFRVDPPWSGIESPQHIERHDLQPGDSVVVRGELSYPGTVAPGDVIVRPPAWLGYVVLGLLGGGILALLLRFVTHERSVGRFGNPIAMDAVDEDWLKGNVFSLRPEVVGAAWDGKVGAAEVAAVLAGLVQEGKIKTSVERRFLRKPKLVMQLLVDRANLDGYRGDVLRHLFFGDRVTTDTDAVRKHYKNTGLNLAGLIEDPINRQLARLPCWNGKTSPANWRRNFILLGLAFAGLFVAAFLGGPNSGGLTSSVGFVGLCSLATGSVAARFNAPAIDRVVLRFAFVGVFLLPLVGGMAYYAANAPAYLFYTPELIAGTLWTLAVVNLVVDALRTNERPEKIAVRKNLLMARRYLKSQLRLPNPRLHDAWYPYFLAFGLGANVDRWFRAYGGASARSSTSASDASAAGSSSVGSGSSGSWTGGGGSFGGAGASGSWASAAGAVGAGIASSSSSSSGGSSSSSGGSSSGGGGGGGW